MLVLYGDSNDKSQKRIRSTTTRNPSKHAIKQVIFLSERTTLGPAYNEFGYYEYPAITSRFLCIRTIYSNVKKFGYYEHPSTTSSFLCICLLVISGTRCICQIPFSTIYLSLIMNKHPIIIMYWTTLLIVLTNPTVIPILLTPKENWLNNYLRGCFWLCMFYFCLS